MARIAVELKKLLRAAGWEFLRQARGDHEVWRNPATGQKATIDNNSKSRHLANDILKAAGLPKAF
ncbi:MAG: type II toxin-antitoxin system HicA family toxin [Phyllobacteriaceae bacterium]|nr:type II toxin-antitoxin system HicA family toxin [Phyllobacteriaceae bacterium]